MASKRVVVISDLHCGHMVGLTPPIWQSRPMNRPDTSKHDKWAVLQKVMWGHYIAALKRVKPIDVLIVNGDMIDGKGQRSGGTEEIMAARDVQATMATHCILEAESPKIRMTYGTSYHSGNGEDWENQVLVALKAEDNGLDLKIGSHDVIDVNGCIIDFRHFVSRTTVPYGKGTPLGKQWIDNVLYAEQGLRPKAQIIVRSHVHYCSFCGDPDWYAVSTPALQGMGSKYGSRVCDGIVHFGLIAFDITETGAWNPHLDTIVIKEQAMTAEKL